MFYYSRAEAKRKKGFRKFVEQIDKKKSLTAQKLMFFEDDGDNGT
jgi:hypothetical protein